MAPLGRRGLLKRGLIRFKNRNNKKNAAEQDAIDVQNGLNKPKDNVFENPDAVWLEADLLEFRKSDLLFSKSEKFVPQKVFVSSSSIYHRSPDASSIQRTILFSDIAGIIYHGMSNDDKKSSFRDLDEFGREFDEAEIQDLEPCCFSICTSYCGFHRGQKFLFKVPRYWTRAVCLLHHFFSNDVACCFSEKTITKYGRQPL
jgi:hypothetical protein